MLVRWIYRAIEIESLGGLGGPKAYHYPDRVVRFYLAGLAARDRLQVELDSAAEAARSSPSNG